MLFAPAHREKGRECLNAQKSTSDNLPANEEDSQSSPAKTMADPFEVRMRFTNQLRQLNASVTSAQKAAQYALKYHEWGEDLHSCILEQLERVC